MLINRIYRAAAQTLKVFESKSEMDEHIAAHRLAAGRRLHKNAREALDIIVKHSVVVPGVCWLATDTLAKKLDTCERTVRNIFARLESLGIGQRKIIELNGMELRFFVLNPFILPEVCTEVSVNLSTHESDENASVPTDSAAFSDAETIEPTELKETNKDDDDDVYNAHAREESQIDNENTMQFNVCQAEIYETAQEYGFNDDTARLLALRCEGIRTTATAISNALVAVITRISDASLPRVMSVPAYFYATLRDEANRERVTYVHRQKERQERGRKQREAAAFKPYNWLADVM
ncbi:hypothetical protein [Aneurinibacillus sp. UBA3580]|uniref:hypothetical protein n=1 Tax=Aneurinibacillus sp. UBA3580 TaxID=1946041 RepID=UPI00257A9402|nr:hypothetical protein [Aneurinibacillus sp. UBA3580]